MILSRLTDLHRAARHAALRRDVRRAAMVLGGITGALALVLIFTSGKGEKSAAHTEGEFGRGNRTGSIVFMPMVGDSCKQSAFDNDSGAIRPTDDVSCMQAMGRAQNSSNDGARASGIMAIGDRFRK